MSNAIAKGLHAVVDILKNQEKDRLLQAEALLCAKMQLWDSEKFPFTPEYWDEYGFSCFSQSNEDGLIQYLIHRVEVPNKTFIEFGVEDYSECNTRFLLEHNNWSGFIMDGSVKAMESLKSQNIYWKHDLNAKGVFITKENINELIRESGFGTDVGILSIDVDGNDYWIWKAIDCIQPRIVITEFNPIYGAEARVTIPYQEDFYRTKAHYSNLYWGASIAAMASLAKEKGYQLVCTNQMGHNAFFVRKDVGAGIKEVPVQEAYRGHKYRESRDERGSLTFLSSAEGRKLIGDCEVYDLNADAIVKLKEVC